MIQDKDKQPTGGLVISITDDNFVKVGDVSIFLEAIKTSGSKGGRKIVTLRFIGPKQTKIIRIDR